MGVEDVAGQREPVTEIRLERHVECVTLTLNAGLVEADVLATDEHAVRLPIAVHIDTAVRILDDPRRNRRAIPSSQESVVSARADRVLPVEDRAILIETLALISLR